MFAAVASLIRNVRSRRRTRRWTSSSTGCVPEVRWILHRTDCSRRSCNCGDSRAGGIVRVCRLGGGVDPAVDGATSRACCRSWRSRPESTNARVRLMRKFWPALVTTRMDAIHGCGFIHSERGPRDGRRWRCSRTPMGVARPDSDPEGVELNRLRRAVESKRVEIQPFWGRRKSRRQSVARGDPAEGLRSRCCARERGGGELGPW